MFCKKGFLKNFVKFTGKHLRQTLSFNRLAGLRTLTRYRHATAKLKTNIYWKGNAAPEIFWANAWLQLVRNQKKLFGNNWRRSLATLTVLILWHNSLQISLGYQRTIQRNLTFGMVHWKGSFIISVCNQNAFPVSKKNQKYYISLTQTSYVTNDLN